jgi:hypothetical protein
VADITILVTAPRASEGYPYLDEWVAEARGESVEFLIADARAHCADSFPPAMRRIAMPGGSVQGLIDEGMRQARGDWVLLTEDHCRPLPGLFEAYRDARRAHPDADLFAGGVENLTSTSPWSFANFLAGLSHVWPRAAERPADASNANLLVRRRAVPAAEIAVDGGFLALTIARLIAQGRHVDCAAARVDHIVHVAGPLEGMRLEHGIVTAAVVSRREVLALRPAPVQFLRDLASIPYHIAVQPWAIVRHLRGTPQFSLGTALRLAVLGIGIGVVPLKVDLRRWFSRQAPARAEA